MLGDFFVETARHLPAPGEVCPTGVGRDREPGRNGDSQRGHLREADAFAAEKLPAASGLLLEVVDVARTLHGRIKAHAVEHVCR